MLKSDLLELISRGEGAKIEFKTDDVRPESMAKEIVSFANMNGGRIFIGVEDDGRIIGLQKEDLQSWIMDTAIGRHIHPAILPDYEEVSMGDAKVAVVNVPRGVAKPYVLKHHDREDIYVRYGNTCQLTTRARAARLFDVVGPFSAEVLPVYGSRIGELDKRRYGEYFQKILGEVPMENPRKMLVNHSFLVGGENPCHCSIFAHALFAKQPGRRLPQAVARLTVYPGEDKNHDASFDKILDAPFSGFCGELPENAAIEPALHERLISLIEPYVSKDELIKGTHTRKWDYPKTVIRELIVNALAHRDWTKQDCVRVVVYKNRMEITSPGALPNGITIERIKSGAQVLRNPKLVRIFSEYGYLEDQGLGIRRKVIPLMREHNNSEPEFEAAEDYFKVTLWKQNKGIIYINLQNQRRPRRHFCSNSAFDGFLFSYLARVLAGFNSTFLATCTNSSNATGDMSSGFRPSCFSALVIPIPASSLFPLSPFL